MAFDRRTRSLAALAVAATLTVALAGCSGDDPQSSAGKAPSASASASASLSTSVDPSNVSPDNLPTVPEVRDPQGAIGDLVLDDCATEAGKQRVSGVITSSAATPTDFLVTLSWTTSDSDVMGRGFAVLQDVAPGAREEFEIRATVAEGAVLCVPGVVHGTIPSG